MIAAAGGCPPRGGEKWISQQWFNLDEARGGGARPRLAIWRAAPSTNSSSVSDALVDGEAVPSAGVKGPMSHPMRRI